MDRFTSPDVKVRLEHALARLSYEPRFRERREGERRNLRGFGTMPVNVDRRFQGERRSIERRVN